MTTAPTVTVTIVSTIDSDDSDSDSGDSYVSRTFMSNLVWTDFSE